MASAEGVECSLCCEFFDDQTFCPRILSCGHTFCTGCLERLFNADDKISCPTCRDEVSVPQAGVAGLPKNFALLSIINVTPQHNGGESVFICEVCDGKHSASFYCLNCKEDMCKDAACFHTRNKASRDHQIVFLDSQSVSDFCPEHKEPFRLFDKDCGRVVCKGCIKRNHSGHCCLSLAEAASTCRQEMQELATKVGARTEIIKDAQSRVMKASLDMKKVCEETGTLIQSLFKEIHAAITARENVLMNELEQLRLKKAVILTEQQDSLRTFQQSITSTVKGVLSTIQTTGNVELLVARAAIESTLKDIENKSVVLEPAVECVPELVINHKTLLDAINKEGNVVDTSTCAENTTFRGFGLYRAEPGEKKSFTITARDAQKHPRTVGGDLFVVELRNKLGERKAEVNVEDLGNGRYLASYTVPEEPGMYVLTVRFRGAHICEWGVCVRYSFVGMYKRLVWSLT